LTRRGHSFKTTEELANFIDNLAIEYDSKNAMFVDVFQKIQNKEISLETTPIKEKTEYQKFLKLCLENWELLKNSGHIYEEAKAIIIGEAELKVPTLQDKKEFAEENQKGLDQFNGCFTCKHQHSSIKPKVCTDLHCTCGIRG